jgi:hypothetical protein
VASVFLFIGLGVPLYFAYNIQNAKNHAVARSEQPVVTPQNQSLGEVAQAVDSLVPDSLKPIEKSNRLGDISQQGVMPVDLQNQ